jgi:GNAT superfamily N-acetyltransferase
MEDVNYYNGDFMISTNKSKLDLVVIHNYLSNNSYWAQNIPFDVVKTSAENSLAFGVYFKDQQIGYARVITDFATFGYLCDVFILDEFRGQGHSKWLMEKIMTHPNLQGLRRWLLMTKDAHELYKKYNWSILKSPEKCMELVNFSVYK